MVHAKLQEPIHKPWEVCIKGVHSWSDQFLLIFFFACQFMDTFRVTKNSYGSEHGYHRALIAEP